MGSVLSSRYWTCPHCFHEFDYNKRTEVKDHDPDKCKRREELKSIKQSRRNRVQWSLKENLHKKS